MTNAFFGEIRLVSFAFAPKGWAFCNGQLLPINQNQPLFALLGTTYGGDGRVNFALPDLRGRIAIAASQTYTLGAVGGRTTHTLSVAELPAHTHPPRLAPVADRTTPVGSYLANPGKVAFGATTDTTLAPPSVGNVGGSQPHENQPPYLALNYIISLSGIFPSQT